MNEQRDITDILGGADIRRHMDELFASVYEELRSLAHGIAGPKGGCRTIQPTALVHEAYLRMIDQTRINYRGKTHFFAIGAMMVRRVLIDAVRQHRSRKHGGEMSRITLHEISDFPLHPEMDIVDFLAVHDAIEKLAELDDRESKVVELRLFGGLTIEEIAEHLEISPRTVQDDWMHAKCWLKRELAA